MHTEPWGEAGSHACELNNVNVEWRRELRIAFYCSFVVARRYIEPLNWIDLCHRYKVIDILLTTLSFSSKSSL